MRRLTVLAASMAIALTCLGATAAQTSATMRPVIGTPVAVPAQPVAGRRLTIIYRVTRSDTGKPLRTGTMVCQPTTAGRPVAHSESFTGGTARLTLVVPTGATALKVTLTITAAGGSASRTTTYTVASGSLLHKLQGHRNAVFSPDGGRVLTCAAYTVLSDDYTAGIWDADSGRLLRTLDGHTDWVTSAVFSPDGARVVTASWDGTARIWDAESGNLLRTLVGHTRTFAYALFSPDGHRIVTPSADKTARIWDAQSGRLLRALRGHTDGVSSAVFSPDSTRVLTVGSDETARIWDARK